MKDFLKKVVLFTAFTLIGSILFAYAIEMIYYGDATNQEKDGFFFQANLFEVKKNHTYDFVVMGSSNAGEIRPCFVPSVSQNSLNLSFPGGGLNVQKTYLEFFYSKGNNTPKIIYHLDPYVLFTGYGDNEVNYLFDYEPFRLNFAYLILKNLNFRTASKYLFGKVRLLGFATYMDCSINLPSMEGKLSPEAEKNQLDGFYDRIDESAKQQEKLLNLIAVAKAHNTEIIFCLPPSLLSKDPNYENSLAFLNKIAKSHDIQHFDFKKVFESPDKHKYFRDYVHLNQEGAVQFFENYLAPIIEK